MKYLNKGILYYMNSVAETIQLDFTPTVGEVNYVSNQITKQYYTSNFLGTTILIKDGGLRSVYPIDNIFIITHKHLYISEGYTQLIHVGIYGH